MNCVEQNPMTIRLQRIGKVARTLLDEPPADQSSAAVTKKRLAGSG